MGNTSYSRGLSMNNWLEKAKEYGPIGFIIIAGLLSAAVSYGTSSAATTIKLEDLETRQVTVEEETKIDHDLLIRLDQKMTDVWHDLGHKESHN